MKRRLFANEHELRSLGNVTLTTHRVIAHAKHGSGEASTSLLLDQIQWTRLTNGSQPELTGAAVVLGSLAVALGLEGWLVLGSMLGATSLCIGLVNILWRRTTVSIGTGSGRIRARIEGHPDRQRQARSFLDAIEHAAGCVGDVEVMGDATLRKRFLSETRNR